MVLDNGLIHIYTGEGKGKTTASIGLAVRARGAGLKVLFAQLFKEECSEKKMLEKIGIKYMQYISKHPFFKKYSDAEMAVEKKKCLGFVKDAFDAAQKEKSDMLVIDELGPAMSHGLISADDVIRLVKAKHEKMELVMTGRGFPASIVSLADYVSEINAKKHPFDKGVKARKGIEY
ncbi:MAG: cob(I)yrinic acid a,c-diamide adenosyltransferase [archaeon]